MLTYEEWIDGIRELFGPLTLQVDSDGTVTLDRDEESANADA